MFFLGLLSTPLPYLLLAAFYFFGFAMGLFNNKTGDETTQTVVSVTISAEVKEEKTDQSFFYFKVNDNKQDNFRTELIDICKTFQFFPDTGFVSIPRYFLRSYNFLYSNSLFCRPPPVIS